jgi:hypothetical protein
MLLERRTVSRKTPLDGRLEITKRAAQRFDDVDGAFDVDLSGKRTRATIGTMDCTCRGIDNPHVHYFIESAAFKQLAAGDEVDLDLDTATRTVRVEHRRPV